ncbi:PREDICTED: uncharacterized protein LOC109584648 isoform X2 [Amphimedon queenslandica]|uniref:Transmembrane protein 232 n=1 Tax=Amphimedon queenslandica TaxID=400682 RepID=A0AAN0JGV1_AMPQE|nr:PREDICTED: uncharacterized protein LOC109584648 isoform X2 [Amphimedon queenslandica]|eukprot:XP_019856026.1 PREDICTED: uncharacterized protein LOC109584648 isoform X2 [Amphimedon queenslandica]
MPVTRVPVVHKFGICMRSNPQEVEAAKESKKEETSKNKASSPRPQRKSLRNRSCPVITLDFISKYNSSADPEKEELNSVLIRVLEHAKYKCCSFKSNATLSDVSEGWLELIALCQCCGTLQQESLATLASSLLNSSLTPSHVPVLFYMAGIGYHWIKEGSLFSSQFKSGELLLLQVLHSVSLRLYHHHLTGTLQGMYTGSQIRRLKYDFDGLEAHGKSYVDIPEAHLHFKIIIEVGDLICKKYDLPPLQGGGVSSTPAPPTRLTNTPATAMNVQATPLNCASESSGGGGGDHVISSVLWHALDIWQCCYKGCETLNEAMMDLITCSTDFNTEPCIDGILAISILCSAARRDPRVLRFVQGLSIGSSILESIKTENKSQEDETKKEEEEEEGEAYKDTDHCSSLVSDPKNNIATLNVLGMQPKFIEPEVEESDSEEKTREEEEEDDEDYNEVSVYTLSVGTQALIDNESIPDIIQPSSTELSGSNVRERGGDEELVTTTSLEEPSTYKDSYSSYLLHLSSQFDQTLDDNKTSNVSGLLSFKKAEREGGDKKVTLMDALSREEEEEEEEGEEDNASSVGTSINRINLLDDRFQFVKTREEGAKAKSVTLTLPQIPFRTDSRCTHYTHSTAPFSWGAGVLGSVAPESTVYQRSILSTPSTIKTDLSTISLTDFSSWSMDVKLTFVIGLSDIVMYGRDSRLQEQALVRGGGKEGKGAAGYCLIDLASYNDDDPADSGNSWKVRYMALQGLTRVNQACKEIPSRDGFSSVAWDIMQARKMKEKNFKALGAYKIQQWYPPIVRFLAEATTSIPVSLPPPPSLLDDMALQLSNVFLPPVATVISISTDKKGSGNNQSNPKEVVKQLVCYDNIAAKVHSNRQDPGKHKETGSTAPASNYILTTDKILHDIAKKEWEAAMNKEDEEEQKKEEDKLRLMEEAERERKLKKKNESILKNDNVDSKQ